MTKTEFIIAQLHEADSHLRTAMVAAGGMKMVLVTNDIRDAEFCLDDAIARVESYAKVASEKKLKKNLTSSRGCVRI
jgi:hypothetical protein